MACIAGVICLYFRSCRHLSINLFANVTIAEKNHSNCVPDEIISLVLTVNLKNTFLSHLLRMQEN